MITKGTSFISQSWGTCSWLWCHLQRCEGLNLSTGQWRVFVSQRETSVRHILMLTLHWHLYVCYTQIHMWMLSHVWLVLHCNQLKLQRSLCFSPQLPSSRFCFVSWQHLNHCDVTGDQLTCPRVREGDLLWYSDINAVAGCAWRHLFT